MVEVDSADVAGAGCAGAAGAMSTPKPENPIGLRAFAFLQRTLARAFFRVEVSGAERVPRSGPVLLVANHRNSLLDPMLLAVAAGRPVRFLAKAPLFTDPKLGWMVRGSWASPCIGARTSPGGTWAATTWRRSARPPLRSGTGQRSVSSPKG